MADSPGPQLRALVEGRVTRLRDAGVDPQVLEPYAGRIRDQLPDTAEAWTEAARGSGCALHELLTLDAGLVSALTGLELERSLGLYVDGPDGPILAGTWALPPQEAAHVALRQLGPGGAWMFGLPGGPSLAGISASGHATIANALRPAALGPGLPGCAVLHELVHAPRLSDARARLAALELVDGRNWMLADGVSFFGYEQLGSAQILTRVGRKTGHIHANHCFDPALRQREARPRSPLSFRRLELASTIYVQRRPATAEAVLGFFEAVEDAAFADPAQRAGTALAVELRTGRALWRRQLGVPLECARFTTPLCLDPE